jgi:hypothetical protein
MEILLITVAILAIAWVWQFAFLMSLEDGMFYGRHDKILWVAGFILAPLLTPWAFLLWRRVRTRMARQG